LRPAERARRGIAYVPQGREIFPLLTVEENLKTGFAPLKREERTLPDDVFSLFPFWKACCAGAAATCRRPAAAARHRPGAGDTAAALLLDEPTEGIQPSIIKDIGRAITYLRSLGKIAIVLVEQYLDFARELATISWSWTAVLLSILVLATISTRRR